MRCKNFPTPSQPSLEKKAAALAKLQFHNMTKDKQLSGIKLKVVLQKKRLGQALNAKEFAVLAGIAYSNSREWFHIHDFPTFNGVVFWEDFVLWRQRRTGVSSLSNLDKPEKNKSSLEDYHLNLPPKARKILSQA
jgi:hypothetical protein